MEFERLIADLAETAGADIAPDSQGTVWMEVDDVEMTIQSRPKRGDVVAFTLPIEDAAADEHLMRRALELSSAGMGTGGFFLGLHDDSLTLSAVLPLDGLDAEGLGKRLVSLAAATRSVRENLVASVSDAFGAHLEAEEERHSQESGNQFVVRV